MVNHPVEKRLFLRDAAIVGVTLIEPDLTMLRAIGEIRFAALTFMKANQPKTD